MSRNGADVVTKRLLIGLTIVASVGALVVIMLTVIAGVQYRIREEQGLEPIYAADWIVAGTNAALWLFAFAIVSLAVTGTVALLQRRRRRNVRRRSRPSGSSAT